MKFLLGIIACFITTVTFSQNDSSDIAEDESFTSVQVEASFPGGTAAWGRYLQKNLNGKLSKKCLKLPKGQKKITQTVVVAFTVDKEGYISDVRAENASSVCSLFAEEAVRVIKNGPRWVPGEQNGRRVISRKKQSITWVLED